MVEQLLADKKDAKQRYADWLEWLDNESFDQYIEQFD